MVFNGSCQWAVVSKVKTKTHPLLTDQVYCRCRY
jgi:hypothetical protein